MNVAIAVLLLSLLGACATKEGLEARKKKDIASIGFTALFFLVATVAWVVALGISGHTIFGGQP